MKIVCLNSLYFSFLTKRILKDPIKVCLLSEPWSKPKTVSQHSELICRTVVPSHVQCRQNRRGRVSDCPPPPDFCRYITPFQSGGQIMPTTLLLVPPPTWIFRSFYGPDVISKKRRDRIGHKYLPRIEPALIYCFPRVNIRDNLCTVFSVI